jgi:aryl-alcohol dehydrogenase-like predicted oxidoreductase
MWHVQRTIRTLGQTGLMVTPLGLGLAALGRPGYINLGHADDFGADRGIDAATARAHAVLDAAHELGIGYVDVARSYGRAEEMLAGWLRSRSIEPGTIAVGSKWGYTYTAGWRVDAEHHEVKDHSLATLERQLPETLALLGPWLGLYQVHSATLESGVLDDDAVLDELAALRDRGVAIGLTTSGPGQAQVIRRALAIERSGAPVFGVVQATWNVLERSAEAALADAHAAGRGVIVKEALANGRLTDRNTALGPAVRAALASAHAGAASLDQVALAAALARDFVDVVLSGAGTVAQLRSNAAAADLAASLDLDAVASVAQSPDRYWRERAALPWN